ncbi:hypothetical protein L1987_14435 [Smallanthus sonchifolius]|uniref:Uncharacterized protein n=1 Tax=Smallanthus sonchifolius TaxID=185202 RepID=A0ACB9J3U2_9ASTR|nr:hypothetical protein L1987_14435 [Smallanthus sonchifolius]
MASIQKTFIFDDVAKHNKIDNCWIIISGKCFIFIHSSAKEAVDKFQDLIKIMPDDDKVKELLSEYVNSWNDIIIQNSVFNCAAHNALNAEQLHQVHTILLCDFRDDPTFGAPALLLVDFQVNKVVEIAVSLMKRKQLHPVSEGPLELPFTTSSSTNVPQHSLFANLFGLKKSLSKYINVLWMYLA